VSGSWHDKAGDDHRQARGESDDVTAGKSGHLGPPGGLPVRAHIAPADTH
jgi:hypothetical protein